MALKDWRKKNSENIHVLSEGAKKRSFYAFERKNPNKYGTYPAIALQKNIIGGYIVGFYGTNRNQIKTFRTKQQALKYAREYMRKY